MNISKHIVLIFSGLLTTLVFAQPINRSLPADTYFYSPTINTANQLTFPNGSSTTAALQTMINNLSNTGGGVLTIDAGTYTLEQVHMKTGVHIRVHPNVVFKSAPQNALFRAGYSNSFENVNNWSFESTNGEKFTFDFSDFLPNEDIRAFQLGNTNNFKLSDFKVLDNYTKFNAISSGAVGGTPASFATFGIIENIDVEKAHYGYGLMQCQVGQNILFRNLSCEGGVTLRLESGFEGLADRYLTDQTVIIDQIYGRNISCTNGAHAVMLSPHTIMQGIVDIRDINGISCEAAVSITSGFLSATKGQTAPDYSPGTFSEESVIANISATYGTDAQVRSIRLRYVPCALRGYISIDKNPDDESYKSPALAPVYYLALEDYVSFNNVPGTYQVVLDNVTHSGFSSEVRADGLITDGGENDFEGCDISAFIEVDDRNTPNPLQTSTEATPLGLDDTLNKLNVLVYQNENSNILTIVSDFNAEIKIYNTLGQLVKGLNKTTQKVEIDVSSFQSSIYIIQLYNKGKKVSVKIAIR
jgi:hypothetical protein